MFKLLQDISHGLNNEEKNTNGTVKQISNESGKMILRDAGLGSRAGLFERRLTLVQD